MKPVILSILAVSVLLWAGCNKGSNKARSAANCTELTAGNDQISVCLQKVLQDSRCPVNTDCIWAGVAVAQFTFTKNGEQQVIILSTANIGSTNQRDTTIQGYNVELVNLYPYPGSSTPAEQKAEVKITRL